MNDFVDANPSLQQRAKRLAGLCGSGLCVSRAVWRIVHTAQFATVASDSAGEESLRRGFPADASKILAVRFEQVTVEIACSDHVDELLGGVTLLLGDVVAYRIEPESHGERRRP